MSTRWYQTPARWNSTVRGLGRSKEADPMFESYADSLFGSKFVVCARGSEPSSMRLFEAMSGGWCPVILSDDWLPPPFVIGAPAR